MYRKACFMTSICSFHLCDTLFKPRGKISSDFPALSIDTDDFRKAVFGVLKFNDPRRPLSFNGKVTDCEMLSELLDDGGMCTCPSSSTDWLCFACFNLAALKSNVSGDGSFSKSLQACFLILFTEPWLKEDSLLDFLEDCVEDDAVRSLHFFAF